MQLSHKELKMNKPTMALSPLIVAMSVAAISPASAAPPVKTGTTSKGTALTNTNGISLYTFDKDTEGKSACIGPCVANWPVLKAEVGDQAIDNYTIIKRDDGSRQWAYKSKPLYTFVKDQKAGDITGDGFLNGLWHLARP
jgi:predicted lipoprotein with Yx(FWY)xxD motif